MITYPDAKLPVTSSSEMAEVVAMDVKTKKLYRLTNDSFEDKHPYWSNDGKRIIFASSRPLGGMFSGGAPSKLYILDIASGDVKRIDKEIVQAFPSELALDNITPAWSPVSNQIAFVSNFSDSCRLVLFDFDTRQLKVLATISFPDKLRWSPSGRYIAYSTSSMESLSDNTSFEFEIGLFDLIRGSNSMIAKTKNAEWELVGWQRKPEKLVLSYADSVSAPVAVYSYDLASASRQLIATTRERWPRECGENTDEILFERDNGNYTYDVWIYGMSSGASQQLTSDGKSKESLLFFTRK